MSGNIIQILMFKTQIQYHKQYVFQVIIDMGKIIIASSQFFFLHSPCLKLKLSHFVRLCVRAYTVPVCNLCNRQCKDFNVHLFCECQNIVRIREKVLGLCCEQL